jgi:hypothetical protein
MKIVFLSDFFLEDFVGGAEASDDALIEAFSDKNIQIKKVRCRNYNLNRDKDIFYIISNFATLDTESINFISKNCKYIIYEHDYKFLSLRDPAKYENCNPGPNDVINLEFYNNALCVFLQTTKHAEIYKNTTGLSNYETINGSLWSKSNFEALEKYCNVEKQDKCAIVGYKYFNKGTINSIEYCMKNNIQYDIVQTDQFFEPFIANLSKYKKLIFMPVCYESCSRITLEARMLNMSVTLNKNVPVQFEEYFKTIKGQELINLMKSLPAIVSDKILKRFT